MRKQATLLRPPNPDNIPWELRVLARDVSNALELERQLDAEILRAKTWSAQWWSVLAEMDRVRTQLISWRRDGMVGVGRSSAADKTRVMKVGSLVCPECETLIYQGPAAKATTFAQVVCPKCSLVLDRVPG
jgi:hypothetical protein